jgi:hypothetical protein
MDEIYARDSKRNSQPQNSGGAAPNNGERIRCRNQRCRCKLAHPTDNHHKAFCSRYCFEQFYYWRCRVCEEPIKKGRRRKQPHHCHDHRCRKEFRRYPEAYSYTHRDCNYGSENAHFTGVKSAINDGSPVHFDSRPMPGWHWDDTKVEGEHWLYAHSRVVAIASPTEDHWQIRYPKTFPVQRATTLEAARKLAFHVALWTRPIGGIGPKPKPREKISEAEWLRRDLDDAQYVAEDKERLRTEPLDASGNYALRPRGAVSEESASEAAKQESPDLRREGLAAEGAS